VNGANDTEVRRDLREEVRAQHPGLGEALLEDARVTCAHRAERFEFRSRGDAVLQSIRLALTSDAYFAQVLYRVKTRLQARGIPILPRLMHRLTMTIAQVSIGDATVVAPGLYLLHGQVVVDGFSRIETGAVIGPFVTIGLRAGDIQGPNIGANVSIGTGAKLIGPIEIGAGATIGANAVVVDDVPPGATVVGAPARPIEGRSEVAAPGGNGGLA